MINKNSALNNDSQALFLLQKRMAERTFLSENNNKEKFVL